MSDSTNTSQAPQWREVRMSANYDWQDFVGLQQNWLNQSTHRPFPSTKVFVGDELWAEVNSLGCFGPELEPDVPVIGLFGDSYVQGRLGGWPLHVRVPGCQPLNGAIEGSSLTAIADRFSEVRDRTPLLCAAVHTGWHNLIYNDTSFLHWEAQLDRIQGVPLIAHFRLTADINDEAVERGYDALYGPGYAKTAFVVDPPTIRNFKAQIDKKNRWLERYCEWRGRPLIDLDALLLPRDYAALAANFFDAIHPRPEVYDRIGAAVAEQLAPHIAKVMDQAPSSHRAQPSSPSPATATSTSPQGANYPLW